MSDNERRLFQRIVESGLYIERTTVPSQRASTKHSFTRFEVCNAKGDLLGKGQSEQAAIDQAWVKFQKRASQGNK